ncbi:MAG: HAMP domain-containing histidine kinase [Chloroflexi bacterium]|nr:HAMP domain-containing histidine kinase [Chloroflexota bacterium]
MATASPATKGNRSMLRQAARPDQPDVGDCSRNTRESPANSAQLLELVGLISHELRTPISTISASVDLILTERMGTLQPLQREFLTSVKLSARQIIRLAEDILNLYRAEAGQLRLRLDSVDLHQVAGHAVEQMEPLAAQYQVSLLNQVDSLLPPILADGLRLEQVLMNLIGNAVKFIHQGGSIAIRAADGHGMLVVSVHDAGAIPSAKKDKIFERLLLASNVEAQGTIGSGLGLVAAKLIVEQHGGQIWVDREPGKRSAFHFSIPKLQQRVCTSTSRRASLLSRVSRS